MPQRTAETNPRDRVLFEADSLFYSRGVRAVGVDLLILQAEVAKATFYRHFPSKDDLIVAYVQRRSARWLEWLDDATAERSDRPREQLLAVFDVLEAHIAAPEFRGCPVTNAVAEAGVDIPGVLEAGRTHHRRLRDQIGATAAAAGLDAVDAVAGRWDLLITGVMTLGVLPDAPNPAVIARAAARHFLAGSA